MKKNNTTIHSDCLFCYAQLKDRIVKENGSAVAILDIYPVTKGHHLIITKRHVEDYFHISTGERNDTEALIRILEKRIRKKDPTVTGFNLGVNIGVAAGQTVFHVHLHLIPRRDGDTPDPRGGVRGVIPGKRSY